MKRSLLSIEGYSEVTTGGNCTALSRLFAIGREILLTDGDMVAPSRFPCWAGFYYLGRLNAECTVRSESDLRTFEVTHAAEV